MLTISLTTAGRKIDVLCVGAHCDDVEIGCGGTVDLIQRRYPNSRIHYMVLTSTPARRVEALAAVRGLVRRSARGEIRIHDLPDGHLPAHLGDVKARFEEMKRAVNPSLVLTHHGLDRHQDHRLVSEVSWQTFREHLIWEYEIPKYDGDLSTPNMYVPLSAAIAERKVRAISAAFPSQSQKSWFSADNMRAMMRLRGLECRSASGFAEAFHCRKLTFGPARPGATKVTPTRRRADGTRARRTR